MSDIEILGRPLYLPIKHKLQDEQSSLVQIKSKQSKSTLTYTDTYSFYEDGLKKLSRIEKEIKKKNE
jgi:hypothetical protein